MGSYSILKTNENIKQSNTLSLELVQEALTSLKIALVQPKDEFVRDAVVQRFEESFDLSWKTLKRFLKLYYQFDENHLKRTFSCSGSL